LTKSSRLLLSQASDKLWAPPASNYPRAMIKTETNNHSVNTVPPRTILTRA
jgi:hypothetical protein